MSLHSTRARSCFGPDARFTHRARVQKLGRSDNVREFVRKGCSSGKVQLVISGGPDHADYTVERVLQAEGSGSVFKIDGAPPPPPSASRTSRLFSLFVVLLACAKLYACQQLYPRDHVVLRGRAVVQRARRVASHVALHLMYIVQAM
jgi:hypothetical protein